MPTEIYHNSMFCLVSRETGKTRSSTRMDDLPSKPVCAAGSGLL